MDFNAIELLPIPLTMAFCEFAKLIGIPAKYIPMVAVVAGVLLSLGFNNFEASFTNIVTGVAYGFSSIGIYSGVKNTIK
jgi:hypothetical protein